PSRGSFLRVEGVLTQTGLAVAREADEVVSHESDVDHRLDVAGLQGGPCHPPEDAPVVGQNPDSPQDSGEDAQTLLDVLFLDPTPGPLSRGRGGGGGWC